MMAREKDCVLVSVDSEDKKSTEETSRRNDVTDCSESRDASERPRSISCEHGSSESSVVNTRAISQRMMCVYIYTVERP